MLLNVYLKPHLLTVISLRSSSFIHSLIGIKPSSQEPAKNNLQAAALRCLEPVQTSLLL